jgi:hypothetical protein
MKILFKILTLLIVISPLQLNAQNRILSGEYWFDNEIQNKSAISISPSADISISREIDVSSLGEGLHTIHIRLLDDNLFYSPAVSAFFIKSNNDEVTGSGNLQKYQYWFDNDLNQVKTIDVGDQIVIKLKENLDVSTLGNGLHTLHIRFMDSNSRWSPAISKFFIFNEKSGEITNNNLVELEYWFDSQIENSIKKSYTTEKTIEFIDDLELSHLDPGLHTIHLRFRDAMDLYSPAITNYFIKLREANPSVEFKLSAYRYWFDDSEVIYKAISDPTAELFLVDSINMKLKPRGEYILHMQFQDEQGLWSSTFSDTLEKISFPYAELSSDQMISCLNDSVLFSAMVVDADSFAWDFGDLGTSSELSLNYAYKQAGIYQVSAAITDRENDISATFNLKNDITVHKLPVIDLGEDIDLCVGDSTSISGPGAMTSYSWSNGSTEESVVVRSEGRYFLVVEDVNSCLNQDSVDITLRSLPVIDIGDTLKILDTESVNIDAGEGFDSYSWNETMGGRFYTKEGSELGIGEFVLRVQVENEFGCFNSDTLTILVSTIDGFNEDAIINFRIYPNPVKDKINLKWDKSLAGTFQLIIIDVKGKPWVSKELYGKEEEMNLEHLPSGNYFLILKSEEKSKSIPIVKL